MKLSKLSFRTSDRKKRADQSNSSTVPKNTTTKRVQVFIEDFDLKLKESFNLYQSSLSNYSSFSNNTNICHNYGGISERLRQTNECTLIDNESVLDYINLVYQKYSIPNPLGQSTPREIHQFNISDQKENQIYSTTLKPTLRSHQGLLESKSDQSLFSVSFSTVRKPKPTVTIKKSKFDVGETQVFNSQKKNRIITLRSKSVLKKSVNLFNESQSFNMKMNDTKGNSLATESVIENSLINNKKREIESTFRYCFMCEKAVLQGNLMFHERECKLLQKAMHLSLKQIKDLLEQKIKKLIKQVKDSLLNRTDEQILRQHRQISEKTEKWLGRLQKGPEIGSDLRIQNYTQSLRDFIELQKSLKQKITSVQLASKLNWFCKLRQNLLHYK